MNRRIEDLSHRPASLKSFQASMPSTCIRLVVGDLGKITYCFGQYVVSVRPPYRPLA